MSRADGRTCREDVSAQLEMSGLAADKFVLAQRTGFKPSTVSKVLTQLRKEKLVLLHRRKYWGWL